MLIPLFLFRLLVTRAMNPPRSRPRSARNPAGTTILQGDFRQFTLLSRHLAPGGWTSPELSRPRTLEDSQTPPSRPPTTLRSCPLIFLPLGAPAPSPPSVTELTHSSSFSFFFFTFLVSHTLAQTIWHFLSRNPLGTSSRFLHMRHQPLRARLAQHGTICQRPSLVDQPVFAFLLLFF